MAWASLQEAVEAVRVAGIATPKETIQRAVSTAGLIRPGSLPLPDRTPAAPRVRVITPREPVGMDWLQAPVLDFERSEILCRSYMAGTQEEFRHPRDVHPARIELWREDIDRLWPTTTVAAVVAVAGKRGAKQKYDWDVGEASIRKMLDERGDPTDPKNSAPGWNSKASIAAALVECLTPRGGDDAPDMETARPYARRFLEKWQQDQAG